MEDSKEQCDDSKTDAPSSSISKDLSKSLPEEAFNNFLQGKRHMLVQDYQFAVQSLATACELYVNHFGEMAIECGEVYFLYGKALFRLSQQQAGVLALNDGSNEEDDENSSESGSKENENEKNSDQEGGDENNETEEGGDENNETEEGGDDNNDSEEADDEKEPSESTDSPQAVVEDISSEAKAKVEDSSNSVEDVKAAVTKDEPAESKGTDDKVTSSGEKKAEEQTAENPETEEDDLELAWNTLETAKTIFQRQDSVESLLKIAEILQLLSEISMESDNNSAAISDLSECLKIQKKHLKPDDRILAETYYQMGLALMLDKQYHEALENFRTTKSILELRLKNLRNTPVDESAGSFASADKDSEISDLENILLDIQEKVEDTESLIINRKKEMEDAFTSAMVTSPVKDKGEPSATVKPISNITHLVKRKKPDEGTSEGDAKRIKISPVPNGD